MSDPFEEIQFEAMLLGRYLTPNRNQAGDSTLDRSAYTLLSRLELEGPMSIGQLSEAFGLDSSTLNRQTAAMLRSGLVERIPDPEGGLARKFAVTETGLRELSTDRASKLAGLRKVLEDWPDDDVVELAKYLRRFNTEIELRDGRPWPRERE